MKRALTLYGLLLVTGSHTATLRAKEKPKAAMTCAELQIQFNNTWEWSLSKVHKVFGQPSRIDRGAYDVGSGRQDVLVFKFPGCYFYLSVNGQGNVGYVTNGFHYQPSELLGKSAPAPAPQQTQVDAVYASIQALENRIKKLEASELQLAKTVEALQSALTTRTGTRSAIPSPAPSRPRTGDISTYLTGPVDYAGVGSGHWLQEISSNGRIIELEDGSLWEIGLTDQIDTSLWLPTTDITVQRASPANGEYRYVLINKEDGEKATAKFLGTG